MTFGQYLTEARIRNGFKSQRALAIACGISNATIARMENDEQKPMPRTLKTLSKYLDVTYEDLMRAAGYLDDVSGEVNTA